MTRSFRGLMLIVGIFCSLTLAVAAPVAAQTDTVDVDIAEVADLVSEADTDDLLVALEEPIADKDLPEGFSDAEFLDPDDVTAESGLLTGDSLEGSLGSVAYNLTGDPEVIGGLNVVVSVQYVAYDEEEAGDDPLGDFIEGAEGGLEGAVPEGGEASVETVDLEGEDAALITFSMEDSGIGVVVQYLAIPVGNVFVFASVTVAGEEVDADDVYDSTEALALSSIAHLGAVAEDA
jgi:hypothetical protein